MQEINRELLQKKLKLILNFWIKQIQILLALKNNFNYNLNNFYFKKIKFISAKIYWFIIKRNNFIFIRIGKIINKIKTNKFYKQYKFPITVILVFLFLVLAQNSIFIFVGEKFIDWHSASVTAKALSDSKITIIPTDININNSAYLIKLVGATGLLHNLASFTISPSKYALSSFWVEKI